jgi:hypothetical protein
MDSATQALPQRAKPALQVKVQAGGNPAPAAAHAEVALAGTGHGEQLVPHVATSKSDTQSVPQRWKPAAQVSPHSLPSQVAMALGGTAQASQRVPHVAVSKFETHWFPHRWKPARQVKSHAPPVQLGMALGPPTPEQSRQRAPQAVTVVEGKQLPPQSVVVGGQLQTERVVSHNCPPPQFALLWHPNSHRLVRLSQK